MINYRMVILFLSLAILSGCAAVNPQGMTGPVQKISLGEVVASPHVLKGKEVLWGGKIIKTVNKKEGTQVEVLQLPLDGNGKPKDVDTSEGRFFFWSEDYLDVMIYRPGRKVTVTGEIQGVKNAPLAEMEYIYPLLKATHVHLWELDPASIKVYHEYPPLFYRYPIWWGYPY